MLEIIGTFMIGAAASTFSGLIGAGGGLITTPFFLIFIGLPAHVAVATARVGTIGLGIGALGRFTRRDGNVKWRLGLAWSLVAAISAFLGPRLLLTIPAPAVEKIIGGIMLVMAPMLIFKRRLGIVALSVSRRRRLVGFVLYPIAVLAQAAFGGLGFVGLVIFMYFWGLTQIQANATGRIPDLAIAVLSVGSFALQGAVHWPLGVALALGMVAGGYTGSHLAILAGNLWIKRVFIAVLITMAIKLLI